jgi:hypothetical protein
MKICRTLPEGISMLEAMCGLQGAFSVAHNAFLEFVQETGVDSGRPLACSGNALRMERSLASNPQQQVFASLGQAALETLGWGPVRPLASLPWEAILSACVTGLPISHSKE